MKKYLKLIRINQWIKNLLIFIPLICSKTFDSQSIISCIIAFFSYSCMASSVYILNDLKDIEKDILHPKKKNRVIASGQVGKKSAIYILIILFILSIILNMFATKSILSIPLYILMFYMIINILYSLGLKNIAIIDVIILVCCYILRIYYGAYIINVVVSDWLFLTILSAALFLGLGKRKKDLKYNSVLKYNEDFLKSFQYLSLGLTISFYSLWAIEQHTKGLIFSVPLLIIIFIRYCYNIELSDEGDPTNIFYQDKFLMITSLLYGILMLVLLIV